MLCLILSEWWPKCSQLLLAIWGDWAMKTYVPRRLIQLWSHQENTLGVRGVFCFCGKAVIVSGETSIKIIVLFFLPQSQSQLRHSQLRKENKKTLWHLRYQGNRVRLLFANIFNLGESKFSDHGILSTHLHLHFGCHKQKSITFSFDYSSWNINRSKQQTWTNINHIIFSINTPT